MHMKAGWGAAVAALCVVAITTSAADAAEYTEGMNSITLTGATDGTTNTRAEAIAAYNTAHSTSYDVSSFNGGTAALFGLGGAAVGAILGAVVTVFVKKKKRADS